MKAPQQGGLEVYGLVKTLLTVVITVLVCAVAGGGVYIFVLAPKLAAPVEPAAASGHGSAHSASSHAAPAKHEEEDDEEEGAIPEGSEPFDLPEAQAAVVQVEPNEKASILTYTMSIICENLETKHIVEKNKQWFIAMLADLHRGKTRKDLEDPEFQKAIIKQAMEEGNSLLRRLQKEPNPEIAIYKFLYLKFAVFTLP